MKHYILIALLLLMACGNRMSGQTSSSANSTTGSTHSSLSNGVAISKNTVSSRTDSLARGKKYFQGDQVDINVVKAKEYYTKTLTDTSAENMNDLGLIYLESTSSARDLQKAFHLFEKAAALHYAPAMVNLAHMYQSGIDIKQNFTKAFQLYQQAASQNNLEAIYQVGYFSYKGFGTQQSYQNGIRYFTIGANSGNARCLYMLGNCYLHGYGVPQNVNVAQEYFMKAFKNGDDHAAYASIYHVIDTIKKYPTLTGSSLPRIMPQITNATDADSLAGRWSGELYVYDWSRTRVEAVENTTLELKASGKNLIGTWLKNGNTVLQFTAVKESAAWKIEKTSIDNKKGSYFQLTTLTCILNHRKDSLYITGNLDRIEKEENEPLRPTYFVLLKEPTPISALTMVRTLPSLSIKNNLPIVFTGTATDTIPYLGERNSNTTLSVLVPEDYLTGNYSFALGDYGFMSSDKQYKDIQSIN